MADWLQRRNIMAEVLPDCGMLESPFRGDFLVLSVPDKVNQTSINGCNVSYVLKVGKYQKGRGKTAST